MTAPALARRPTAPAAHPTPPAPVPPPAGSPRALLWRSLRGRRRDVALASLLFSTHQLGEALVPVLVGATVGTAVRDGTPGSLAWRLGLLAADFLLLSLSYRFGARASVRARQHIEHQVRLALVERVLRPAGGVRLPPGELLGRASGDAERVGVFARTLATTVAATVVLLGAAVLLLRISVGLGALVVAGTAVLLLAQNRLARVLRRRSGAEQAQQARATALAEDLVRGLRVLKGIGAERAVAADYARVSRDAVRAGRAAVSAEAALTSVGVLLTGLYLCAVTAVAGGLALDGRIGLGQLIAVLGLARFVIGPMRVVSAVPAGHARALASAARIHEILNTPAAVTDLESATASASTGRPTQASDSASGTATVGASTVGTATVGTSTVGAAAAEARAEGAPEAEGGMTGVATAKRAATAVGGSSEGAATGKTCGAEAATAKTCAAGAGSSEAANAGLRAVGAGGAEAVSAAPRAFGTECAEAVSAAGTFGAAAVGAGADGATPPVAPAPGSGPSLGGLPAEPPLTSASLPAPELRFDGAELPGGLRAHWSVPGGTMTGLACDDPAVAVAVAQLLAREGDPASGSVQVGAADLRALPLDHLRATVLVCHHEPVLLPGTIADNLSALTDDRTAVAEAAHASLADQVVATVAYGADTSVGDRGETLSGGQRQRIALGRALAARPPVLVLHDPTTAVDAATEDVIAARVRAARAGRTTLVITSSPAWLARCDQVVHVPPTDGTEGSDAADGTPPAHHAEAGETGALPDRAAHRPAPGKAATR
ncbi:ABC transporter ATP-binding protein [Streptomyces sp. NPDC007084]|uniref:ABC transporter ATP-binding protein n=1 Tax=Streptomyces sp. NPDC007084 TaxID=3154313 RepID=UPI0034528B9A